MRLRRSYLQAGRVFLVALWLGWGEGVGGALHADGIPLLRRLFGRATLGEARFRETIGKLNRFAEYGFIEAYRTETTLAFYSAKASTLCWLLHHDSDDYADRLARDLAEFKVPVFRYGNWVGYCPSGDVEKLAEAVRYILVGAGEWRS